MPVGVHRVVTFPSCRPYMPGRPFAHAIVRFARHDSLRYPMSEAARAFTIARDWSHEIDRLEDLFQSIAQTPSAVAAPITWPTSASVG